MNAETFWQWWAFLLSLSKVQLILLGAALALLVAVSKIFRFLFLLGFLVVCLTVVLPAATKIYSQSPAGNIVSYLLQLGKTLTQDPASVLPSPSPTPEAPEKEKK